MNLVTGITPDAYKQELRRAHYLHNVSARFRRPIDRYQAAIEDARKCWGAYEQVNRDFLPDDPVYSAARNGFTPGAGSDIFTFSAVASRTYRVLELIHGSEGTASAATRAGWAASSGGTTGGGGVTPEKFNANSPTSMFTSSNLFTTWSAQPTSPASGRAYIVVFGWNAFGGFVDWKAMPGEEIYHTNEQASWRNLAGTAVRSDTVIWEEI